jgi:hypothetical protein
MALPFLEIAIDERFAHLFLFSLSMFLVLELHLLSLLFLCSAAVLSYMPDMGTYNTGSKLALILSL